MKVNIGPYPDDEEARRTVKVTIDKYDTWNLDHTLALVILPALKQFRASPGKGAPASLRTDESDDGLFELWDDYLDAMIVAFEEILKDESDTYFNEKVQYGLDLFAKYYRHLWI